MSTFDGGNTYYSGQGVVLMGDRDALGAPKGLIAVGNVSALALGLESTVLEHKESQSGLRSIDLRLITEIKSSVTMTVENWSKTALAAALVGDYTEKAGTAVADEPSVLYFNRVSPMQYIKVSSVVVTRTDGAQVLTAYTNSSTPYDYELNTEAGSVRFNDGSLIAQDHMCTGSTITAPTSVTPGAATVLTWAATPPSELTAVGVGGRIAVDGFTGADAALLNAKAHLVTAIDTSAKTITLGTNTAGKTITIGIPLLVPQGAAITFDYNYAGQNIVDAMTQTVAEKYLRFEGLNTADGNNPVVVEVFRFRADPLKQLALISDTVGPYELAGSALADTLRLTGSKFFKITQLR